MTIEEKRKAIEKHCDDTPLCIFCKLNNSTVKGCYRSDLTDLEIENNYEILFGDKTEDTKTDTEDRVEPAIDPVNRPAHYTDGKIEVIEFIEDKKLGFCLGNAVKYIARAGKKDPTKEIEDLNKARWYIERRIKELEEGKA